ncbi:MAG: hypothetical protein ACKVLA_11280 [Rhodobacterales bacterium]
MDLENFVAQTLTDIIRGVHKAKVDNYELSSIIPGSIDGKRQEIDTKVSFDIAVTTSEETKKGASNDLEAGGSIKVLGAQIGLKNRTIFNIGNSKSDMRVSRIAFDVPIQMNKHHRDDPTMPDERKLVYSVLNAKNSK